MPPSTLVYRAFVLYPSRGKRAVATWKIALLPWIHFVSPSSDSDFEFDRTCIDAGVGYSFSTSVDIGPWTTPNSQLLRSTLSHSLSQSLVLNPVGTLSSALRMLYHIFNTVSLP